VQPLLAELKDLHVVMVMPDGKEVPTFASAAARNFDARAITGQLKEVQQIGRMGLTARTPEGYGYLAIGTLTADQKTTADLLAVFDALLDAKGLIIDIRPNAGGAEPVAQQIVSRLIERPLLYAKNQFRGSANYEDLILVGTRQLTPHSDKPFRGPVVGLIGPGCVSSGEGMALMLKALPQAKLIGQPTRGASGNPQPVSLPNGVTVRYSTWVPLGLDDRPFEGVGIAPAVAIDADPTGVKGLDAAIADLNARLK
jgi:Periplasmic protease